MKVIQNKYDYDVSILYAITEDYVLLVGIVCGEIPTPSSDILADQNLVPAEVFIVKVCHKRRKVCTKALSFYWMCAAALQFVSLERTIVHAHHCI